MIGLIAYVVVGIWCLIGWRVCRYLITKRMRASPLKWALVLLFWVAWLVGPIADEIIGRREFDEACAQLPEKQFFGPVHIGAGVFFDEHGERRWKTEKEFTRIRIDTNEWRRLFRWDNERAQTSYFPVPIFRSDTTIYYAPSNTPSLTTSSLLSTGGWIRRGVGWGNHSAWTCRSKGTWPRDEDMIIY